jgi:predicted ribosomally synthesized peptide with SipW-like signal peptide
MKTIILNILALVLVVAIGLPMIGGTMATWSDSETMMDNYIATGSLDLLVAQCDEEWLNPGAFNDDLPWGVGLDPCFYIPEVELDETYSCYIVLWNAGFIDGVSYLHLKDIPEGNPLAATTFMHIWYDYDADPDTPVELVATDTLANLNCQSIELGLLQTEQRSQLLLELVTAPTPPSGSLSFDISFQLIQRDLLGPRYAWADTECSHNALNMLIERGGSPGFWSNPAAVEQYEKAEIVAWFKKIVAASTWYDADLVAGDNNNVYKNMLGILKSRSSAGYKGMVNNFRAQYLATRLNTMPDPPRLQLETIHDISTVPDAREYFGYENATLAQIIATIESNSEGNIFTNPPTRSQMEIMKSVCDALNNP